MNLSRKEKGKFAFCKTENHFNVFEA